MESLLTQLRACAEPTRLRLLALAGLGSFCVMEFSEILGQSQPRLSRHLRLLTEAGLLERTREGANVWFALPHDADGALVRDLLARLPDAEPVLAADRRQAARVLAERARVASDAFRRQGADWDEMRALDLPAAAVAAALKRLLPGESLGRLLDIGTGTGTLLEFLAPSVASAVGVDASRTMLALARTRLARPEFGHCTVRLGDMYRLPFGAAEFDLAVLQMVLHYAEDPAGVIAEAARVLRPGGRLIVIDLVAHGRDDLAHRLAHRWPGFSDASLEQFFAQAGLLGKSPFTIAGPLSIALWPALQPAPAVRQTTTTPAPAFVA